MNGYVHSIESFGSVDGPGIRFVLFLQGCALRCLYCHNPDSWKMREGKSRSVTEIMAEVIKYKEFLQVSGGGITVSGGDPLLQIPFVTELFKECKKQGIHTNLDTSGDIILSDHHREQLDQLLSVTDMIMLDIKVFDSERHQQLTGKTNEHILEFGRFVSKANIPIWIRHVLVPGVTGDDEDLEKIANYIRSLKTVEKIEVLPYHSLGAYKWEQLGYEYRLKDIQPPDAETVSRAEKILKAAL